ncbi:MAG: GTP cyclohydrolase I FolE2 [Firmicutes bacterium]|nr:GTP cyclohydrolase I FolE2 [Bacillota bacterium]
MEDVQNKLDTRGIEIHRVGVKDVHLPVLIATKDGAFQQVLGKFTVAALLPRQYKGTHMSRFMEVLVEWGEKPISGRELKLMLTEVKKRLNAPTADISLEFRYFIPVTAPVSGQKAPLDYPCRFWGRLSEEGYEFLLSAEVPVLSLCPCSKAISRYGAHNQRTVIKADVRCHPGTYLWLEDLVPCLQAQGSSCIYPVLKREDEKYVTEEAYEHPKFVEDILRDSVLALRQEKKIAWFRLEVESFESIHNHSAFAFYEETLASGHQELNGQKRQSSPAG